MDERIKPNFRDDFLINALAGRIAVALLNVPNVLLSFSRPSRGNVDITVELLGTDPTHPLKRWTLKRTFALASPPYVLDHLIDELVDWAKHTSAEHELTV